MSNSIDFCQTKLYILPNTKNFLTRIAKLLECFAISGEISPNLVTLLRSNVKEINSKQEYSHVRIHLKALRVLPTIKDS